MTKLIPTLQLSNILLVFYLFFTIIRPIIVFRTTKNIFYLEGFVFFAILPTYYTLILQGIHPLFIFLGLFLGSLMIPFSVFVSKLSLKETIKFCSNLSYIAPFYKNNLNLFFAQFVAAFYEEFFWRGALQTFLGANYIAVIIVAIVFTIRHIEVLCDNFWRMFDFFLFSLILGLIYLLTKSLMFVILLHFIRNLGVTFYQSNKHYRMVNN